MNTTTDRLFFDTCWDTKFQRKFTLFLVPRAWKSHRKITKFHLHFAGLKESWHFVKKDKSHGKVMKSRANCCLSHELKQLLSLSLFIIIHRLNSVIKWSRKGHIIALEKSWTFIFFQVHEPWFMLQRYRNLCLFLSQVDRPCLSKSPHWCRLPTKCDGGETEKWAAGAQEVSRNWWDVRDLSQPKERDIKGSQVTLGF